ncbi:MAG: sulfite exporter TauE/SafE family protein [Thermodesulfobacteriota bacterium]
MEDVMMDHLLAYFSVSGVKTWVFVPPMVAFIISVVTSMGGVSGAFLLLPFQMSFLGYTHPSVSATNQFFNIVAIPSGVYRYRKEGRMLWSLTWVIIAGTLPGVFMGAVIRIAYLPDPGKFKLFAGAVLLYLGFKMIRDLLKMKNPGGGENGGAEKRFQVLARGFRGKSSQAFDRSDPLPAIKTTRFNLKRLEYTFYGERFEIPIWAILALSFLVGVVGGVYGVGGGAFIAPFLVTFLGLPVYTVAGASLMGTFVTSIAGVAFYHCIAPFYPGMSVAPDWALGMLFGLGGSAGMYMGARWQKFVPAWIIKWILAAVIVFTAVKYVAAFFGL